MPNHINQKIAHLSELVEKGLYKELSDVLESGAIDVSKHEELVSGISDKLRCLIQNLMSVRHCDLTELEDLVRTHVRNRNLFRT